MKTANYINTLLKRGTDVGNHIEIYQSEVDDLLGSGWLARRGSAGEMIAIVRDTFDCRARVILEVLPYPPPMLITATYVVEATKLAWQACSLATVETADEICLIQRQGAHPAPDDTRAFVCKTRGSSINRAVTLGMLRSTVRANDRSEGGADETS